MMSKQEVITILSKSKRIHEDDDLDFEVEEKSEEFLEPFEYKDRYYAHKKTKKEIRLYARTWKFGKDPLDKSNLWRVSIQMVENGVVIAESPIHTDWCEKDQVLQYVANNPKFSDYKELKSAPKRRRKK